MSKEHQYTADLHWRGDHTRTYESYTREHVVRFSGKPDLVATADPLFLGDAALYDPEDLLMAALSGCHLLTYLALCARARIDVRSYRDKARGTLLLTPEGGGHFTEVVLHPEVIVAEPGHCEKATALHTAAHKYCFIASSMNFPVRCEPLVHSAER